METRLALAREVNDIAETCTRTIESVHRLCPAARAGSWTLPANNGAKSVTHKGLDRKTVATIGREIAWPTPIAIVAATDPDSESVLTWLVHFGRLGRTRSILPVEILE
jgi:hypothetical protein